MNKNFSNHLSKICIVLFCLFYSNTFAQNTDVVYTNNSDFKLHKKGEIYVNWGYNRSWFNTSDIHFWGQGHDFMLYDVKANDRPSELNWDYVKLTTWSIPQFNFRIGYMISDKYGITIGWDHMKYVAINFQNVLMYGNVDPSRVADPVMQANMKLINDKYAPNGLYNGVNVAMSPKDFIHIEHTDGLNYASIDLERYDKLWQLPQYNKLGLSLVSGVGAGLIIPRTDANLFGSGRNHFWNISGWGFSAKLGLRLNLTKHIYFQTDFKCGYLELLNIHTTDHAGIDQAQQHIVFYETYGQIGFKF